MMPLRYEKTRIYALDKAGKLAAEITFPMVRPGVYCIDHTFVDPSLRGQGVADQLVRAALDHIRAQGGTPAATCTYAQAWMARHAPQT